jgi:hypothetical protein
LLLGVDKVKVQLNFRIRHIFLFLRGYSGCGAFHILGGRPVISDSSVLTAHEQHNIKGSLYHLDFKHGSQYIA